MSLSHSARSRDAQQPVSARTLRLFTVSADDEAAAAAAAVQETKNPRWLATREKEARGDAIRDKIICLIDDIEAEEAKARPALKKSWLREKKLELRRISFKQAEGVIAGEEVFRKVRRKLRAARRKKGDDDDDVVEDSDGGGGGGGDSSEDEAVDSAGGAGQKRTGRRKASSKRDRGDDSTVDGSNGSAFDLNPSGRLARPNPRAAAENAEESQSKTSRKSIKNASKVARFPLETGYKLGRMIRKRREKRRKSGNKANGEDTSSSENDSDASEGGEWGRRVDTPEGRDRLGRRRPSDDRRLSLSADEGDGVGPAIRVVVVDDSDEDAAGGGGSDRGSRRDSAVADIPELQESVGKKIRDRLAIRRHNRSRSGGGSGEESGPDSSKDNKKQQKNDKKKEKLKKTKSKKDKEESKTSAKKKAAKAAKEKDAVEGVGRASRASSNISEPVQFIELEDADVD